MLLGEEKKLRESIVDLAQIEPGEKVLDVGCGAGSLTIAAKLKTGPTTEIHGPDAAPEIVYLKHRRAKRGAKLARQVIFRSGW